MEPAAAFRGALANVASGRNCRPVIRVVCWLTGTPILNLSVLLKNHVNTVLAEWMKQSDGG